ncbi:hypothetical protein [Nocardia concava]|uniref:hypothetical protein n=1 Tax=Nocardia concava TaxID=257281 RepID=UPI0012F7F707|nr:hypothetical protein [Nocardia concava]
MRVSIAAEFAAHTFTFGWIEAEWAWNPCAGCRSVRIIAILNHFRHEIGEVDHDGREPLKEVSQLANQLGLEIASQHGLRFRPAPDEPPIPEQPIREELPDYGWTDPYAE